MVIEEASLPGESEGASEIKIGSVDLGEIKLKFREIGEGCPIILLHGVTANAAVWDPILLNLRSCFKLVSLDQRGHGLSEKPMFGYSGLDYANDIIRLIEILGVPAIVVGHSLGARNSLVTAALRPDLVRAAIAIDFIPFIEPEVFDALEFRVGNGDRLFATRDEVLGYLSQRYPLLPADALKRRLDFGYQNLGGCFRPLAAPLAMLETVAGLRENIELSVQQITCPVLLMRGEQSSLVSPAALEQTVKLRPDFSWAVVANADHYIPEEAPHAVADAILNFAALLE